MQTHNNQPSRTYQLPRRRPCDAIDIATTINTTICQQYAVYESTARGGEYMWGWYILCHVQIIGTYSNQTGWQSNIQQSTFIWLLGIEVHIGVEESMSLLCIASLHNCMTTQYTPLHHTKVC